MIKNLEDNIADLNPDDIDREFSVHIAETEADMDEALGEEDLDLLSEEPEQGWNADTTENREEIKARADSAPQVPTAMSMYLAQISEIKEYPPEKLNEKVRLYRETVATGDEKKALRIRNDIVEHNLRLVIAVAKQYRRSFTSAEFMDVIQTGNEGVIHAVERFDPEMGYRFSTYAWWWIRQYIGRAVQDNRSNMKLSTALALDVSKANYILSKKEEQSQEENIQILQKHFGWTKKHAQEVEHYAKVQRISSLNSFTGGKDGGENDTEVGDLLPDYDNQYESAENEIVNEKLSEILNKLPHENATDIMMRYYGIGEYAAPQTIEEIALEYMLPKSKIQAIIRKSHAYLAKKPELKEALARIGED